MLAKFYTSNLDNSGKSANFGVVIEPRGPDSMVVQIVFSKALPEMQWVLVPNKEIEFVDMTEKGDGADMLYDFCVNKLTEDVDSPTEIE